MSGTEQAEAAQTSSSIPAKDPPASAEPSQQSQGAAESYVSSSQRPTGTVKWFSVNKGFGFIQPDDGGEEVFVHQTSIKAEGFRSLREAEPVEYDLELGEDGRGKAINVTGPQGSAPQGAPRRVMSAMPYAMAGAMVPAQVQFPYYDPYGAYQPMFRPGRFPGRSAYPFPGRGMPYGGRGFGPSLERPPPPGTPGVSSGFQVVVHNLPWSVTWQVLKDVFSHTPGIVRADVIIDSAGRSRGFGTVRYKSREEAVQAAEMMNNANIGGRMVTVRIDRFA